MSFIFGKRILGNLPRQKHTLVRSQIIIATLFFKRSNLMCIRSVNIRQQARTARDFNDRNVFVIYIFRTADVRQRR